MSEFRLVPLDDSHFPEVHRTFVSAFADYAVDVSALTEPLLRARAIKNGVDFSTSVGAFDDNGAMVGFTLVGLDAWKGAPAAYDIMTGIVPRARGRGLANGMFEFLRPRLRARGVVRFVLEVLQQNEAAIRAYRKAGFAVTREFACLELELAPRRAAVRAPTPAPAGLVLEVAERSALAAFEDALDWTPSWEQTFSSLRRVPDGLDVYVARIGAAPAGLLAYHPGSQRLFTLVVRPEHRRRGVATRLVAQLLAVLPRHVHSIRSIDVDASDAGMIALLRGLGFDLLPTQFEMEAKL